MLQKVSVIIPFKGKENLCNLELSLKSLINQILKPLEIIIVGSKEDLKTIKSNKNKIGLAIKKIYIQSDKNTARNIGVKQAKGPYILSMDHDMIANSDLLEKCQRLIKKYDALIIPEVGKPGNFLANCRRLEKELVHYDKAVLVPTFFRKSLFKNESPFDNNFGSLDEWGFDMKLKAKKAKITIVDSNFIVGQEYPRFFDSIKVKFQRGYSYVNLSRFNKNESWKKINPFERGFVLYIKQLNYFYKDPIHFIALVIIKSFDLLAFFIGYVLGMITSKLSKDYIEKDIIKIYNEQKEKYLERNYLNRRWNRYVDNMEKRMVKKMWKFDKSDFSSQSILDLGMGPGRWSKFFLESGLGKVVGVDISPKMVLYARKTIKDRRFKTFCTNISKLPFKENQFDKVFIFRALVYVMDYKSAIKEMLRVAKPGGEILIEVANNNLLARLMKLISIIVLNLFPNTSRESYWRYYNYVKFFTLTEITVLVKNNQTTIIEANPLFVLPSIQPPAFIDRYFYRALILIDKSLINILPKDLFVRSWVLNIKKK